MGSWLEDSALVHSNWKMQAIRADFFAQLFASGYHIRKPPILRHLLRIWMAMRSLLQGLQLWQRVRHVCILQYHQCTRRHRLWGLATGSQLGGGTRARIWFSLRKFVFRIEWLQCRSKVHGDCFLPFFKACEKHRWGKGILTKEWTAAPASLVIAFSLTFTYPCFVYLPCLDILLASAPKYACQ